jgi:hypothetical protein
MPSQEPEANENSMKWSVFFGDKMEWNNLNLLTTGWKANGHSNALKIILLIFYHVSKSIFSTCLYNAHNQQKAKIESSANWGKECGDAWQQSINGECLSHAKPGCQRSDGKSAKECANRHSGKEQRLLGTVEHWLWRLWLLEFCKKCPFVCFIFVFG